MRFYDAFTAELRKLAGRVFFSGKEGTIPLKADEPTLKAWKEKWGKYQASIPAPTSKQIGESKGLYEKRPDWKTRVRTVIRREVPIRGIQVAS